MTVTTSVEAALDYTTFSEARVMGQVMRQIGVVIGLTVVLTFPVTVVSGAGSQKHSDRARSTASGGKPLAHAAGDVIGKPDKVPSRAAAMRSQGAHHR